MQPGFGVGRRGEGRLEGVSHSFCLQNTQEDAHQSDERMSECSMTIATPSGRQSEVSATEEQTPQVGGDDVAW